MTGRGVISILQGKRCCRVALSWPLQCAHRAVLAAGILGVMFAIEGLYGAVNYHPHSILRVCVAAGHAIVLRSVRSVIV